MSHNQEQKVTTKPVWIVMGSDSDLKVLAEAADLLDQFGVGYEVTIASAHRAGDYLLEQLERVTADGAEVIIAAAGLAAALPGVLAAATTLPVIGIPLASGSLAGIDALYSIVQMPPGIPVATVGVGAALNAALLSVKILSLSDPLLQEKLAAYRLRLREGVVAKDKRLHELGIASYLEGMKK